MNLYVNSVPWRISWNHRWIPVNEFKYTIMVEIINFKLIRIQPQICFSEGKCFTRPKKSSPLFCSQLTAGPTPNDSVVDSGVTMSELRYSSWRFFGFGWPGMQAMTPNGQQTRTLVRMISNGCQKANHELSNTKPFVQRKRMMAQRLSGANLFLQHQAFRWTKKKWWVNGFQSRIHFAKTEHFVETKRNNGETAVNSEFKFPNEAFG